MADEHDQTKQPESQPAAEDGEGGFSAAFAERSADPAGQAEKQSDDEPEEGKSSEEEPAKAGSEEAPAKEAATEQATSGEAKAFDPWAGMTPEQRSYWERKESSERSNRGRVGALTKKLNTFSNASPAPSAAPKKQEEQGKADEGKSDEEEAETTASDLDKELQKVVEDYGDVVGPIAEVLKKVRAEIEDLKKAPAIKDEIDSDAEAIAEALGALEKVHPDYQAIASDKNFAAWLADQPQKVIDLANSYDPREVSLTLTLYKTERSAATAKQSGEGGEKEGQEADQGKQDSTATDDKRKRQLEGSRQVPGKGQPAAAGVPNDFSSAFKARAEATAKT